MKEALTTEQKLAEIRKRTDAQRSRYGFHWNQLLRDRRDLLAIADHKQSQIDALMLEFCPERMTRTQKAEWAKSQKPVEVSL